MDISKDKIYPPSAYITDNELLEISSFNLVVHISSIHLLIAVHPNMPPPITHPGSFFSSSPAHPPPSKSITTDTTHIKQTTQAASSLLPSCSAPARQIDAPKAYALPAAQPQHPPNTKKHPDASAIPIVADGHVFDIPADLVERYVWVREQTVASYRAVTAGTATAREMAFIFGAPYLADAKKAPDSANHKRTIREPIQSNGAKHGKGEEFGKTVAIGIAQRTDPAARVLQEHVLQEKPRPKRAAEVIEISDNDDGSIGSSTRRIKHHPAAASAPPNLPRVHDQPSDSSTREHLPASYPAPYPAGFVRFDRRQHQMTNFVGHFVDYADAKASTGMARVWIMGKYIDGALSLGGRVADTVVMESRCTKCAKAGANAVCMVMVKGGDDWVDSRKCGACVRSGGACSIEARMKAM